jgi:hypothetical protein
MVKENNPPTPSIRIEADGVFARIFVNDEQLKGVRSYTLTHKRNEIPILHVDLACGAITSDISDVMITFAPTSEQHGCEQDKEDYGEIKALKAHFEGLGTSEQEGNDSDERSRT